MGATEPRLLRRLVLFSADPWNSALPILRVRGPAEAAGVAVIQGNDGDVVWPERVTDGDLIVIQRDFPRFRAFETVLSAARAASTPIVYESDDLLFDVPAHHPAHEAYSDHLLGLLGAILQADLVVVSTPLLAEAHLPFNPNTHVWLNHLNERLWSLRPPPPPAVPASADAPCVIGYMGGATHQPDLEMIAGLLARLLDRYAGRLRLHFWSAPPPASLRERSDVAHTPLDPDDYARSAALFNAQTCDIAVAPLVDTPLGRAKSHLKFLEYTALGAPGIYSRLPPYTGIVRHGENGLLAGDEAEWERCLVELIESPERRHALALAAHNEVRDQWLMSRGAVKWQALYETVLSPDFRRQPLVDGRQTLAHIAAVVQARQHALEHHLGELRAQARELGERRQELEAIYASPAWRLAQTLGRWRTRLAPDGSLRQRWLDRLAGLKRPNKI
jgi:glycosyltransferase involved in cell wall biosynthesis